MGCTQSRDLSVYRASTDCHIEKPKTEFKLLLLGAGRVGKSTFVKQLQTIHGEGYPENIRKTYKPVILENTISQMQAILNIAFDNNQLQSIENVASKESALLLLDYQSIEVNVDSQLATSIEILWQEPIIQKIFNQRGQYGVIEDSSKYFFENFKRFVSDSYVPTCQDILLLRQPTIGIIEKQYQFKGHYLKIIDVGGQRSQRKKWIHCFEKVTSVLFVASLSSYNEVTFEDDDRNAMLDSLELFDEIVNTPWFESTAMILFLNKMDLFKQKIKECPLSVCFPNYDGEQSYDAGLKYITEQFEEIHTQSKPKLRSEGRRSGQMLYPHVTCATDTDNVKKLFTDVQTIVINRVLADSGIFM